MDSFFIKSLLVLLLLTVASCTPSAPYEIKSPCVSGDVNTETIGITPCLRRPANLNYDIA